MGQKKQSPNHGGPAGADPAGATGQPGAAGGFAALFEDRAQAAAAPAPSPIQWTCESLDELRRVRDRLRGPFRGEYSGDFITIEARVVTVAPALQRQMDAFARAQEVLSALRIEAMARGESFSFTAEATEQKTGTIRMQTADYAYLDRFVEQARASGHAGRSSFQR